MLKKLLYLYNDGHNPFPKLGKGGLGYHLPQYPNVIHGNGLNVRRNEDGTFIDIVDDHNDLDTNWYDMMNPNGPLIVDMRNNIPDGRFEEAEEEEEEEEESEEEEEEAKEEASQKEVVPIKYDELSDAAFAHIDSLLTYRGKLNYINNLLILIIINYLEID
jgi:hypothetical protein